MTWDIHEKNYGIVSKSDLFEIRAQQGPRRRNPYVKCMTTIVNILHLLRMWHYGKKTRSVRENNICLLFLTEPNGTAWSDQGAYPAIIKVLPFQTILNTLYSNFNFQNPNGPDNNMQFLTCLAKFTSEAFSPKPFLAQY